MSHDPILLPSGRSFQPIVAPTGPAFKLRRTVASELRKAETNLDLSKLNIDEDLDPRKLDGGAINSIKNVFCELLASEELEKDVFVCLARCTIDGQRVTRDSFEPEETRGDFLPCALEVIKINVGPFFASVDLSFLTPARGKAVDRPSA